MEDMMAKLSSLLEQKETLTKYKDLLEMEREVTLKRQFARFMESIGIDNYKIIDEYFPRFRSTVSVVEDEDMSVKDRMVSIVESDFLFDLMRLKTAENDDSKFLKNLLTNSLRTIADEIDPKENRGVGQPMTEAWIQAMKEGMDTYLTSL